MTISDLVEILKFLGATLVPILAFSVRYVWKLRKDVNVAHARIRDLTDRLDELESPRCEVKSCPIKKGQR